MWCGVIFCVEKVWLCVRCVVWCEVLGTWFAREVVVRLLMVCDGTLALCKGGIVAFCFGLVVWRRLVSFR